ncbi:hypothetical protein [Prosthecochloris vibrioformis]|uniref:Glycosyltransferase family 61 protein n=1 Tax=Prosthecochloris vibrioformis TaxID=1098 RepID=A0A5C4RSW1_PROVB|nr:hypothetical protein [Prosthecochloris vibrioformis]TNJ34072.1 hypothetical protein FGF68_10510 [Prosthecochloris vibrioformis]
MDAVKANQLYLLGEYDKARVLYDQLSQKLGIGLFDANIRLCKKYKSLDLRLTDDLATQLKFKKDNFGNILVHEDPEVQKKNYMRVSSARPLCKPITGLLIKRLGRFSNALMQISNAVFIAKKIGLKSIYISDCDRSKIMFPSSEKIFLNDADIVIETHTPYRYNKTLLEGAFFYTNRNDYFHNDSNRYSDIQSFKHGLGLYYDNKISTYDLVIYVRSGDIFSQNNYIHPGYGQPPLSYYIKIIKNIRPNKIQIVFENRFNPVIDELEGFIKDNSIPYAVQSGSIREDINALLSARSIISGNGTFLPGIISLSENIETVYSFQKPFSFWGRKGVNNIIVRDAVGDYKNAILSGNWQNSPEQRQLMIQYPESSLKII